jgi:hypothetical protein
MNRGFIIYLLFFLYLLVPWADKNIIANFKEIIITKVQVIKTHVTSSNAKYFTSYLAENIHDDYTLLKL